MMIIQYPQRRFSSVGRASALQAEGQRFESVNLHHLNADLAQLVEQLTCNQQVGGSIPLVGTSGEVAKWLNAADCKSAPQGSVVRIHFSPPQLAQQPSGKASDFDSDMRQFESSLGSHICVVYVLLAQLVEHLTFNQRVGRSNRPRVTTYICRCSSMVELQPSKLTTWVRFPSPAPFYI